MRLSGPVSSNDTDAALDVQWNEGWCVVAGVVARVVSPPCPLRCKSILGVNQFGTVMQATKDETADYLVAFDRWRVATDEYHAAVLRLIAGSVAISAGW